MKLRIRNRLLLAGLMAGASMIASSGKAQTEVKAAKGWESPVQRGSIPIGGTGSFILVRDIGNDQGRSSLDIAPRVGYFVAKGLAISANVRYRGVWYDDQPTVRDQTFKDWGIGPGATYYVSTRSPRVFPFIAARTFYSRGRNRFDRFASAQSPEPVEEGVTSRSTTGSWQVAAGVMYMLVKHVGVTGEGFYQRDRSTIRSPQGQESSNSAEQYGVQWGLAAFIF